jgi:hypothetical protein
MAVKVEKWKSPSGKEFDTEIEALRDEVDYWRALYHVTRSSQPEANPRQAYAESGGHE